MVYEFLEHTADVRFRVSSGTLEELFEEAARAFTDSMTDPSLVDERMEVEVEVEGDDLEELLAKWLDELVYLFSAEVKVFGRFEVGEIRSMDGGLVLKGAAFGEEADPGRHTFETEVKGVSYHGMEVAETDSGWEATVLLDV